MESHNDAFPPSSGFFDQGIGDAFRNLALLVGGASLQHGDLNHRHKQFPVPGSQ
jgi:hypothetical protein